MVGQGVRGVVFDLDGVLVDAADWHYAALNQALAPHGVEVGKVEHREQFNGLPTRRKLEMLTAAGRLPADAHDEVASAKQRLTLQIARERVVPQPEQRKMLADLRRDGCRLAVASNSLHETIEEFLGRAGIADLFDAAIGNDDVSRPKPAPDVYQRAAVLLRCEPSECLAVEDTAVGAAAAAAAGLRVLQVAGVHEVTYANVTAACR
jgi:beta-phosphoglucomutase